MQKKVACAKSSNNCYWGWGDKKEEREGNSFETSADRHKYRTGISEGLSHGHNKETGEDSKPQKLRKNCGLHHIQGEGVQAAMYLQRDRFTGRSYFRAGRNAGEK